MGQPYSPPILGEVMRRGTSHAEWECFPLSANFAPPTLPDVARDEDRQL